MAIKKINTLNIHENPSTNEDPFDVENYLNANFEKIIDVVDNNADELSESIIEVDTELNSTSTNPVQNKVINVKIQSLQSELIQTKKDLNNSTLTISGQGEDITLNNTVEASFKKAPLPEGNSKQDGTPTPENEEPIYSVGDDGSITEKIYNKNDFDKDNTTIEMGSINTSGALIASTTRARAYNITIEPNKTYTISSSNSNLNIVPYYYNENNTFISYDNGWKTLPFTFTAPNNAKILKILFKNAVTDTISLNEITNIQIEKGSTATSYTEHQEQTYTIPTQQPMRSIGNVRDGFVKVNGVWNEKHIPYIASYNGETLPTDVYTEEGGIKYCNSKSMSTTGQFSTGASVQYIDESNWNYIPCTEEQIAILNEIEKYSESYQDVTHIFSTDEVSPYFEVEARGDINSLREAIVALGGVI